MNAVATSLKAESRPASGSKARRAAPANTSRVDDILPDAATKWEHIRSALWTASRTEEGHPPGATGESDRLLRIASDLANLAAEQPPGEDTELSRAYDIAALINAARLVPGDLESAARADRIAAAARVLVTFTDAESVSEILLTDVPRPVRPIPAKDTTNTPSEGRDRAEDLAYYRLDQAEAVIRIAAEEDGTSLVGEALWAAAIIIGMARDLLPLGARLTFTQVSKAGSHLAQAEAVLRLASEKSEDILISAGLSLLAAAQHFISEAEGDVRHD